VKTPSFSSKEDISPRPQSSARSKSLTRTGGSVMKHDIQRLKEQKVCLLLFVIVRSLLVLLYLNLLGVFFIFVFCLFFFIFCFV
jgi:predicted RND superfamily exporter protein